MLDRQITYIHVLLISPPRLGWRSLHGITSASQLSGSHIPAASSSLLPNSSRISPRVVEAALATKAESRAQEVRRLGGILGCRMRSIQQVGLEEGS